MYRGTPLGDGEGLENEVTLKREKSWSRRWTIADQWEETSLEREGGWSECLGWQVSASSGRTSSEKIADKMDTGTISSSLQGEEPGLDVVQETSTDLGHGTELDMTHLPSWAVSQPTHDPAHPWPLPTHDFASYITSPTTDLAHPWHWWTWNQPGDTALFFSHLARGSHASEKHIKAYFGVTESENIWIKSSLYSVI